MSQEVRELTPEDEEKLKKTRRRIEDFLRKTKDVNKILGIAKLLGVDDENIMRGKKRYTTEKVAIFLIVVGLLFSFCHHSRIISGIIT